MRQISDTGFIELLKALVSRSIEDYTYRLKAMTGHERTSELRKGKRSSPIIGDKNAVSDARDFLFGDGEGSLAWWSALAGGRINVEAARDAAISSREKFERSVSLKVLESKRQWWKSVGSKRRKEARSVKLGKISTDALQ